MMAKQYTAWANKNYTVRITSVWAESPDGAREEIERQLDRPGRYDLLRQWRAAGKPITSKHDLDSVEGEEPSLQG